MKTTATHVAAAAKTTMLNFVAASIMLVAYFLGIAAMERSAAEKLSVLLWLAGASFVAGIIALVVFLVASKKETSADTLALSK